MNDMNDQPAWATDPRGLPPALKDRDGYVWPLHEDGVHYEGSTIKDVVTHHGPVTPLWPDTPPTSIDPAAIKVGMRVRRVRDDEGPVVTVEGIVDSTPHNDALTVDGMYLSRSLGEWFLVAEAPDPDEQLVEEVIGASTEQEARELIAMLREQGGARR